MPVSLNSSGTSPRSLVAAAKVAAIALCVIGLVYLGLALILGGVMAAIYDESARRGAIYLLVWCAVAGIISLTSWVLGFLAQEGSVRRSVPCIASSLLVVLEAVALATRNFFVSDLTLAHAPAMGVNVVALVAALALAVCCGLLGRNAHAAVSWDSADEEEPDEEYVDEAQAGEAGWAFPDGVEELAAAADVESTAQLSLDELGTAVFEAMAAEGPLHGTEVPSDTASDASDEELGSEADGVGFAFAGDADEPELEVQAEPAASSASVTTAPSPDAPELAPAMAAPTPAPDLDGVPAPGPGDTMMFVAAAERAAEEAAASAARPGSAAPLGHSGLPAHSAGIPTEPGFDPASVPAASASTSPAPAVPAGTPRASAAPAPADSLMGLFDEEQDEQPVSGGRRPFAGRFGRRFRKDESVDVFGLFDDEEAIDVDSVDASAHKAAGNGGRTR